MAGYRLNGHDCTTANGCKPSKHLVTEVGMNREPTLGGIVLIEPPSGLVRTHTWVYDARSTEDIERLLSFLALDTSPIVLIDTYDVRRDPTTKQDVLLTNLVCVCERPEIGTAGMRSLTEGFSLIFTELFVQS